MPRGQKSKQRAREKRRQARREHQSAQEAQATAAAAGEEESPSSSLPAAGDPGPSAPAAAAPQEPQGAVSPSPGPAAASSSCSSSDEDDGSLGASASAPSSITDPLTWKAGVLVQFLLQKYKLREPVSQAQMLKVVKKKYKAHFPEILRRTCDRLELVFGLDLEEQGPGSQSYVLVSKMALPSREDLDDSSLGLPKNGLLLPLLGMIFISGDRITEEEMWKFLNVLGIYDGRNHFIFGEPRKLITQDLVREQYLEYRQVPDSDPPRFEFLWGPRAHAETSKMKVLEFLAKVSNSVPTSFPSHYEAALRDEAARTQASAAAAAASGDASGDTPGAPGHTSDSSQPK